MSSLPLNQVFEDHLRSYKQPIIRSDLAKVVLETMPITYQSPVETLVGIEYEIEGYRGARKGVGAPDAVHLTHNDLWTLVEDGSLRNNGREFVSRPISGGNIPLAISSLGSMIELEISKADPSTRCGIHVHVNALDLNVSQLFGWISLYRVFERQLYKFSGGRDKNLFCLPTWAFDGHILSGLRYLQGHPFDAAHSLSGNGYKYSGLNTKSLREKGTLEFRQMQTVRDYEKISLWVEYLTRIKGAAADECTTPEALLVYLEKLANLNTSSAYEELLTTTFGERGRFLKFDGWAKDMAQGVILVKEQLAYLRRVKKTGRSEVNMGDMPEQGNPRVGRPAPPNALWEAINAVPRQRAVDPLVAAAIANMQHRFANE